MRKLTIVFFILIGTSNLYAGNFHCTGMVKSIGIDIESGRIAVDTGFGVHYLCSLFDSSYGVNEGVCKAWYSLFLSAQASERTVTQSYHESGTASCSSLGSWTIPNVKPYHVQLNE